MAQRVWHSLPIWVTSSTVLPTETSADRQACKFDAAGGDVLGEVAGIHSQAPGVRILSMLSCASRLTWRCQSPAWASPTMPWFSRSSTAVDRRLAFPFVPADTDGYDPCRHDFDPHSEGGGGAQSEVSPRIFETA